MPASQVRGPHITGASMPALSIPRADITCSATARLRAVPNRPWHDVGEMR